MIATNLQSKTHSWDEPFICSLIIFILPTEDGQSDTDNLKKKLPMLFSPLPDFALVRNASALYYTARLVGTQKWSTFPSVHHWL